MSSSDEGSADEQAQEQLLQQLDKYVSERMGLPVAEKQIKLPTKSGTKKRKHENESGAINAGKIPKSKSSRVKDKFDSRNVEKEIVSSTMCKNNSEGESQTQKKHKKKKRKKAQENERDKLKSEEMKQPTGKKVKKGEPKCTSSHDLQHDTVDNLSNSEESALSDNEMETDMGTNCEKKSTEPDKVIRIHNPEDDDDINDSDFDDDVSGFSDDDNDAMFDDSDVEHDGDTKHSKKQADTAKALEEFKKSVGLTEKDFQQHEAKRKAQAEAQLGSHVVPNKYGVKKRPPPEVVVFQPHQKKKREAKQRSALDEKMMDLRAAKWDVRRFGTSGLDAQDKASSTLQMLIELGAKAPKEKPKNYKDLMQEKKKEKQEKQQKIKERQMFGDMGLVEFGQTGTKKKSRRKLDKNEVSRSSTFGQIGRQKNGAHVISKRDIKRIGRKR